MWESRACDRLGPMALTPSSMVPLGSKAPLFTLSDQLSGNSISLSDYEGVPAVVVMFICNHCPYVKHIQNGLVDLTRLYEHNPSVAFIAINSNDAEAYPDDSPEKMKTEGVAHNYDFPYCFDATQEVARAFGAACTPDFFVLDSNLTVAYRGQLDDSRPGNKLPVTGSDLKDAIDALIAGKAVNLDQKPSVGCNIKWK